MIKIIIKKYDNQGKLKTLEAGEKTTDSIRFKILRSGKLFPCCDYHGTCTNKAHVEAFPMLMKKSKGKEWSYLCKKHYIAENKKFKGRLPVSRKVEW